MPSIYPSSTRQRSIDVLPRPESIRKSGRSSSHHVRRRPSPAPRPHKMKRSHSGGNLQTLTTVDSDFLKRSPSPMRRKPSSVPRSNTMKGSTSVNKSRVKEELYGRSIQADKHQSPMQKRSSSSSSSAPSPGTMLKRLSSREKITSSPMKLDVRTQNSQNNYFPKKSTIDNEISSVSSDPALSKEGRQQSESPTCFKKDNSMREISPMKKLSDCDKSVKIKKEEKLKIRRCIEGTCRNNGGRSDCFNTGLSYILMSNSCE